MSVFVLITSGLPPATEILDKAGNVSSRPRETIFHISRMVQDVGERRGIALKGYNLKVWQSGHTIKTKLLIAA